MSAKTEKSVALIVGAGDATGGAIAKRFAGEGFQVVLTRRKVESLNNLSSEIKTIGGIAHSFGVDARREEEVVPFIEKIEREIGPIEAAVYNVGGNVRFGIHETTSRVFFKVWEMCCFGGFLMGREVSRAMCERKRGTIIFTGATASVRGSSGFSAFAGGKHALRALAQSMAKELMPQNIHVAHVIIDGPIDTEWTRQRFPDMVKERPEDGLLIPEDIAETYWAIHSQKRSAWTFETDVRPWVEPW